MQDAGHEGLLGRGAGAAALAEALKDVGALLQAAASYCSRLLADGIAQDCPSTNLIHRWEDLHQLDEKCSMCNEASWNKESSIPRKWPHAFMMLRCKCAPLPAAVELSFGRKLAVRSCFAAMPQMASLLYSRASVACRASVSQPQPLELVQCVLAPWSDVSITLWGQSRSLPRKAVHCRLE